MIMDGYINMPHAGEYWHVKYGLIKDHNIIVLVLEDISIKPTCKNWTKYGFNCLYKDEKDPPVRKIEIAGELFLEKLYTISKQELEEIKNEYLK